jgi:hypothetical protein
MPPIIRASSCAAGGNDPSFSTSDQQAQPLCEEIDADSLSRVRFIDTQHAFKWHGNHPFESARLRTSRDGRILLATVDDGIVIYRLEP